MPTHEAAALDKIPHVSEDLAGRYSRLTDREKEVMLLVARGFTAPEIGRGLLISPKTVDTYKQRICEKMGFHHRADYFTLALKLGLLV